MGFDDMSDEDKKALLQHLQGQQDTDSPPTDPISQNNGGAQSNPLQDQTPSYASQHVSPDVSQSLNQNESNLDLQQTAKQDALNKLMAQASTLTPMNQKIAEGMGGMGSVGNVAMKEAQPAIKAGVETAFPKLQKFFQVGGKIFPAANTAEAMQVHKALEQKGLVGQNRTLVGPFNK